MRVTLNNSFNQVQQNLHTSRGRMENFQKQASTLKKVNTPSDDPVGSSKILEIRTDKINNEQFWHNAKLAEAFLNNSDHALEELGNLMIRAKEIALGQASGASSTDSTRLGVAEEVSQLYQQAVALANTRIGDRFLFAGYQTDKPAVDPDGLYRGDDGKMMVEIARDVFMSMNVPGLEVFNTSPSNSGDAKRVYGQDAVVRKPGSITRDANGVEISKENVNVFDELQNLRIGLLTGDFGIIQNGLDRFDQLHGKLIGVRAKIGSRIAGLQNTINTLERHNISNADLSSHIEDADMVKVMNDLTKEETVFKSVLNTSKRLLQPTLLDFIR